MSKKQSSTRHHPIGPDRLRRLSIVLVALATIFCFMEGVAWRTWAWEQTQPIRFTGDITRGYRYGRRAALEGYFDLYDKVLVETQGRYLELDYAPLRLWVMMQWARSIPDSLGLPPRWQPEYAFTAPALRFNLVMEVVAATGIFLLVRHWLMRAHRPPSSYEPLTSLAASSPTDAVNALHGWLLPLLGALLFWFNPAVILSAHAWPTWDMWIIPFYVWALYLACKDFWFFSGMVLAVGALFKGQQLIVAPFFLLWPLFMGRPGAALRWAIGFSFGVTAVVSGWMLRVAPEVQRLTEIVSLERPLRPENNAGGLTPEQITQHNLPSLRPAGESVVQWPAVIWVAMVTMGYALIALRRFLPKLRWFWWIAPTLLALGAVIWAWHHAQPFTGQGRLGERLRDDSWWVLAGIILAWTWAAWSLPRRWQGIGLAASVSLALWLCIPMFSASTGWFHIGWAHGEKHWQFFIMGLTDNIPGLFAKRFGFDNQRDLLSVVFTIPQGRLWVWPGADFAVTYKQLFIVIYGLLLGLCSWGAARHARADCSDFLVAAVGPWLMMYLILGQIHERYLLFAVGVASCWVALKNWGLVLMLVLLSLIAFKMPFHVMLIGPARRGNWYAPEGVLLTRETARQWLRWCDATHPDLAWAVIVCAGVVLYWTLRRPRTTIGRLGTAS